MAVSTAQVLDEPRAKVVRESVEELSAPVSSPEQELIVACADTELDSEQAGLVRGLLNQELNWEFISNTARRNGVLPLLCWNLLQKFAADLPPEIKEELALLFQEHTQNNLFLTAKLLEIVRTLTSAGIPVLPFKGATLAIQAYRNLALRRFVDLDLLVQPKHFDEAVQALVASGYKEVQQVGWLKRKSLFFSRQKDTNLVSDDWRVRIELHWKLSGSHFALPFEINQLWERLETINLGGVTVSNLAFADLFVYLCLHGSRHGWERLAWICDVRELVRSVEKTGEKIDWQAVRQHAKKHGCENCVALGLFLIQEFFGVKTDYPAWEEIENNQTFKKVADEIRQRIFAEDTVRSEIGDWRLYHLALKERKTDKIKLQLHYFLWYLRLAVTPNSLDKEIFKLPSMFYPLYFILRPSRLLYALLSVNKTKKL